MKVFLTGISGQLGYDVARELKKRKLDFMGVSSRELDIRDPLAVDAMLTDYRPDAVIHCAAYTKVDHAEEEAEVCWDVNAEGTKNIASVCRRLGARLIYISTDYVFPGNGERFYEPDDPVSPLNVYGMSKYAGELAVRSLVREHFIVRTSWVIGENGGNFVKTMLRLAETHATLSVVDDQIGSPSFTADLAPLLCDMLVSERFGTYHAANEGICSWAELAETIFSYAEKNVLVRHVSTEEYGAVAARPLNSRLNKAKLAENGFAQLPDWRSSLKRYLRCLE